MKAATGPQTGEKVVVWLSRLEADMLALVAGNGWGDGDFEEFLDDKAKSAACQRAMAKLDQARASHTLRNNPEEVKS